MPGLTLTLEVGNRAIIRVPMEDEDGEEYVETIEVAAVRHDTAGRIVVAIEAPRDFQISRERASDRRPQRS